MTATSMTVTSFKKAAAVLPAERSIIIRGDHGIGKSAIVRQVAAIIRERLQKTNPKATFPVIDRRLGQMTEGDMVGLPSTDGNVTRFNPPDWYKQACEQPCMLFLDELNRGTQEVMQASFQIILDRELNGHKLHPETRVYSAINSDAVYTVNEIDPALLSRYWCVDLEVTTEEWLAWGRNDDKLHGGALHFFVTDFIQAQEKFLRPAKNYDPKSQQPTGRGWEFTDRALKAAGIIDEPSDDMFYQLTRGFVGNEAAIAFRDFCRTVDNQVSGEEVLESYHKKAIKAKVDRQTQERLNGLIEKVADHVVKTCTKLTDQQGKNIREFMTKLPMELRISFWSKLTAAGIDKIELAKSVHKHTADLVLEVFGVPMGEAGIGVVPNIPGIFRDQAKSK